MDPPSTYTSALAAERAGRHQAAFRLFEECLAEGDGDPGDIRFHCGWCLEQDSAGDKALALELYKAAANTAREPVCRLNSIFRAGWLLLQAGDRQAAAGLFRRAIDFAQAESLDHEIYHHGAYWYAVCLEAQGRFLSALDWYRTAGSLSRALRPEARLREIDCLLKIGSYGDAYEVCRQFEDPPPSGFDVRRYEELRSLARREGLMLEACLAGEGRDHLAGH